MIDTGLHLAGLELLLAAVHADDPKREILVRVGDAIREARALAVQQDRANVGEFGGMKFIADKAIPNDVIEFHHADGRVDRFRRTSAPPSPVSKGEA